MTRARIRSPSRVANSKRSSAERRPPAACIELGELVQPSRKSDHGYSRSRATSIPLRSSRTASRLEWPPKSGTMQSFPEVDRAAWFTPDEAKAKILPGQRPFIDRLLERLATPALERNC